MLEFSGPFENSNISNREEGRFELLELFDGLEVQIIPIVEIGGRVDLNNLNSQIGVWRPGGASNLNYLNSQMALRIQIVQIIQILHPPPFEILELFDLF